MKKNISKLIAALCIFSMLPATAFAGEQITDELIPIVSEQNENSLTDLNDNENIQEEQNKDIEHKELSQESDNEEGYTDEEWAELQAKVDAEREKAKERKEEFAGYELLLPYGFNDDIELLSVVDEKEPNDTLREANRIYIDDGVYGKISSKSDIDYFKIKFNTYGYVKFALNNVPEDCDYDLYVYGSEGNIIEQGAKGTGKSEYLYTYVTPGIFYYMSVEGYGKNDWSNEEYRVSVTFVEEREQEYALSVGTDFRKNESDTSDDAINTTESAENAASCFQKMGYAVHLITIPNYSLLNSVHNGIDTVGASVVFLNGHGSPTHIYFNYKRIGNAGGVQYGTGVSRDYQWTDDQEGIAPDGRHYVPLDDKIIEDSRLMVFSGCQTAGVPNIGTRNLPQFATKRGVETAIGWEENVKNELQTEWLEIFFYNLKLGRTTIDSARLADEGFFESSGVCSWKIYGNPYSVLNLSGPYSLERNIPYENNMLQNEECILIDFANKDFSGLENAIRDKVGSFNPDDYTFTCKEIYNEAGDELLEMNYTLYIDGFNTGCGFFAFSTNGEVEYLSEKNTDAVITLADAPEITAAMEERAMELALKKAPEDVHVLNQSIERVIIDSEYYLVVNTDYAIHYGSLDEVYGQYGYNYKIK